MAFDDPALKNKSANPDKPPTASLEPTPAEKKDWELIDVEQEHPFLEKTQGNILKGHGRDHVRLVFLRFKNEEPAPAAEKGKSKGKEKEKPGDRLKGIFRTFLAKRHVQSAREQATHERRYKKFGIPGPLFSNVLFSATGYRKLGFTDLSGFNETPKLTVPPKSSNPLVTFANGARSDTVVSTLSDPPVEAWEKGYREEIDALIILADDDTSKLIEVLNETIALFEGVAEILVEVGDALRNEAQDSIEHFGYVDGRSQPLFYQGDMDKEVKELDGEDPTISGTGGYSKFDPTAKKELVLVKDPLATGDDSFGSYFVYRKLEQNVRGFKQQEEALADALRLEGERRELAGAYVVGRFEDGTPVVMRDEPGLNKPVPNNFNYADDVQGSKCPFHSHVRKMNPRGDTVRVFSEKPEDDKKILEEELGRRIARRAIPYGKRTADPADPANISILPTRDVGLLFMCFQANIPDQFAFLQLNWANNESFVKQGTGVDPVIGQLGDADKPVAQKCPLSWGQPGSVRFGFSGFVTMKGGEFFFAPSLTFLNSL